MSEAGRNLSAREAQAELGLVTLGGDPAGVLLGGERRWLNVYSPGGYRWSPVAGEQVLVMKAGAEQESPCVLGTLQGDAPLEPGEVQLTGGEASVRLGSGGLELDGVIRVNGQLLRDYIESVVGAMLTGAGEN